MRLANHFVSTTPAPESYDPSSPESSLEDELPSLNLTDFLTGCITHTDTHVLLVLPTIGNIAAIAVGLFLGYGPGRYRREGPKDREAGITVGTSSEGENQATGS